MGRGKQWWLVLMSAFCILRGVRAPSVPRDASVDAINVISVENMDTLLRMRLADDLQAWNHSGVPPARNRRATEVLCGRTECLCKTTASIWVNASCSFTKKETLELGPGSLPDNLLELQLDNLAELVIQPRAFGSTPALNKVHLLKVSRIRILSGAFHNITSAQLSLRIEESESVTLDSHSFQNMNGYVNAKIASCDQLTLGRIAFGRLSHLHIENVPKLEIETSTFATESTKTSHHGPSPSFLFEKVTFGVIPNETFATSASVIRFQGCHIEAISAKAFHTVQISKVLFQDTTLKTLQSNAFSEKTLIFELEFRNVIIDVIESSILASAVENLTIRDSVIGEIREGAFKITAVRVRLFDNELVAIKRGAFEINGWMDVLIHNNVFKKLDPETFSFPFIKSTNVNEYHFNFTHNMLEKVAVSSLAFIPLEREIQVWVNENQFQEHCGCALHAWTDGLVKTDQPHEESKNLSQVLFDTSMCMVADWLTSCLQLRASAITMTNYTDLICGPGNELLCKEPSQRIYPPDDELDWSQLLDHEKRMLTIILITVIACVTFILIVVTARWVQRKGLIGRIMSQFFRTSSLVATASISRINIHEYAEIQNFRNQTQIHDEVEPEEELIAIDDKATQTLPEELTQDLLQSLREKLEDPENYPEARDMIEHLYDLIKVEESCNNRRSTLLEDSLYAELQPRTRARVRNKQGTSVGTRSPSLDRLDPVHYLPRPAVVNEYAEPRDRQLASHVYCELPMAGRVPDVLMSSNIMANRPLPEAPTESHV